MSQAPPTNGKSKKHLLVIVLVVFVLVLTCLSPFGWILFQIHKGVKQSIVLADSGFRKATNTINPEDLRAWALKMAQEKASGNQTPESMPGYIRNLYSKPPDIEVEGSGVTLMWGGGFFHWGFYIGSTNEMMPFISENTEYPYNFEWVPGIYYTREAKWNLQ
jgi:hypothetical protein